MADPDSMVPRQWAERARYDLDTARAMLDAGRYVYVLFCCQQAIEKALKALIVRQTGQLPPRTHSLPRLAETADVQLEDSQLDFLGELSLGYIRTRYPEEEEALARATTREKAETILTTTEAVAQWLLSMLK